MPSAILVTSGDACANLTDRLIDVLHRSTSVALLVVCGRIQLGAGMLQVGECLLHMGLVYLGGGGHSGARERSNSPAAPSASYRASHL